MSRSALYGIWLAVMGLAILGALFIWDAYLSVSAYPPGSVPVHHDDYTLYAGAAAFQWSWIRPLSFFVIHLLSLAGPPWLSWGIRLLCVLFVLLSWTVLRQVLRPRPHWALLVLFGAVILSTPVIVENARYTGVITQLLSGCLGLGAVALLFLAGAQWEGGRAGRVALFSSALLVVLSALAKEDFVLFYALSAAYAAWRWPTHRKRVLVVAGSALVVCGGLIAASKFVASSSFLGVTDAASTYYVDLAPVSVVRTLGRYLTGGGAPAMEVHGRVVTGMFGLAILAALGLGVYRRGITVTGYFVLGTLAVMAPYAVLPNHVNAYYELLWLPLIVAAVTAGAAEIGEVLPGTWWSGARTSFLVLALLAVVLFYVDRPGRTSLANWYDAKGRANARVLDTLMRHRDAINQAGVVCISGADAFSPWFMHDGRYLYNVMGLDATWLVLNDPASPAHPGLLAGAAASGGDVVVVADSREFPAGCLQLDLAGPK